MRGSLPETAIWNDYWHFDRLASFENLGEANYSQDIEAGWASFFESLPLDASILDLCTGNGAIAVIAAEAAQRGAKNFQIAGVDAADVNPYLYVRRHRDKLASIDFFPATPVERLPWPDGSFDAVVSQFGIEYSDLTRSIAELARVLAPGGKARLSLHAAEGDVVRQSRRVVEEIDFILYEIDLAGRAKRYLRAMGAVEQNADRSSNAERETRESRTAFQEALQEMHTRIAHAADPALLLNAAKILVDLHQRRRHVDVARAMGFVEGIRTEWRNHRGRLVAQVEAAVTRTQRAELANELRRLGAQRVEVSDQIAPGGLIAHCIEAAF